MRRARRRNRPTARSIEAFVLLHCHALRLSTAPTRQALQLCLMHFVYADGAIAHSASLLQALTNSVGFPSQGWAFDHYTAVLNAEIEHAQVADISAELRANSVEKNVV